MFEMPFHFITLTVFKKFLFCVFLDLRKKNSRLSILIIHEVPRQNIPKTSISDPLIRTLTCAFQGAQKC